MTFRHSLATASIAAVLVLAGCAIETHQPANADADAEPSATNNPAPSVAATELPEHNPVGRWGANLDDAGYLLILDDGTFGGNDGCNYVGGSWSLTEGHVAFGDIISTAMLCPDVQAWTFVSATVGPDGLTLLDERGAVSGTLPRVAADE